MVLDYVCMDKEDVWKVRNHFIDEDGVLGGSSDHVMMITTLEVVRGNALTKAKVVKSKERWDFDEGSDWGGFKTVMREELNRMKQDVTHNVEELGQALMQVMTVSLEKAFGRKTVTKRKTRMYPKNVLQELKIKKELTIEWRKARSRTSREATGVNKAEMTRKQLLMEAQDDKTEELLAAFWKTSRSKVIEELSEKTARSSRKFWSYVVDKARKPTSFIHVIDPVKKEVVINQKEVKAVIENYLCGLFQGSFKPFEGRPVTEQDLLEGEAEEEELRVSVGLQEPFSVDEVLRVTRELKNNKAVGVDEIPAEALKNAPEELFVALTNLFNLIQKGGRVPEVWKTGRVVMVPKPGDPMELSNYRPLTVINSMSGLFSKVLNGRLTKEVEEKGFLGEIQQGFRKGRSGAENTFVLNTILAMCAAKGKKPHLAFIDIKKAYDTVSREILWRKLIKLGLGGSFVGMLQAIYTDDRLVTEVNGEVTRSIFLGRGLRQGCSLSPCLFALYITEWGKEIEMSTDGFKLGEATVSGLLFADDLVLCARTADGLDRLLRLSSKHAEQLKLEISVKKSMVISTADREWTLRDKEGEVYASLERVWSYKYLGLETYNTFCRVSTAKQKKCLTAARRYRAACRYLSKAGPDSVDLSVCAWRNVALPATLFGAESVIFANDTIAKLEAEPRVNI